MTNSGVKTEHSRWKRLLAKCWVYGAVLFVTMAIIFSVFRALTPWARQYKPQVETHLSEMLGQPVTIESMDTSWYWFHPVIRLNQVTLTDQHAHKLEIAKLLVGIDLLSSLWHWSVQPGLLYLDHTHVVLHETETGWLVDGLNLSQQDTPLDSEAYLPILKWLASQHKIVIRHITAKVSLQNGAMIPLKHVNLTIQNNSGRYRLKGRVQINQEPKTEVSLFADLYVNPLALKKTKGQLYLSIQSLSLAQWQSYLPTLPMTIQAGKGDITLWLDVLKGRLFEGQTTLSFNDLKLKSNGYGKSWHLSHVAAQLGWKRTKTGWVADGKHVQLALNQFKWPENAFHVEYQSVDQTTKLFVKHLLIQPLMDLKLPWPDALKSIVAMKPQGALYDTGLHFKGQSLDYLLTGFSEVGWMRSETIPAISGLSGVIYWRPHEGRFQLDSHQIKLKMGRLSPIEFDRLNTAIIWKRQQTGTKVSLDHFVLEHPDLTISATGGLDDIEHYPQSNMKVAAQFSVSQAEHWLAYLPDRWLKPKLNQWLKQDVKHIGHAEGSVEIDGLMAHFPFDHDEGTFSVMTNLSGIDLMFAPHWPLARDIRARLSVDKRNLNADVHHANLNGIMIDNLNLRLDDIGLDYETLLLHGKIKAQAKQMVDYVLNTPLKTRLSRLASLDLRGILDLDLQLEVPLYPENDTVLTQGDIVFVNNQATLHFGSTEMKLDKITGGLNFSEKGVLDSQLSTMFLGSPVTVLMHPVQKPLKGLQISFHGHSTIMELQRVFHLPLLTLLNGPLNMNGLLTLTDASDAFDILQLKSSLHDVRIALPEPLGKKRGLNAPLVLKMSFGHQKAMRLNVQYDKRLSADLWFDLNKNQTELNRGEILIGQASAVSPAEKGLKISGKLPFFDQKQWLDAFAKMPVDKSAPSLVDSVRWLDLTFEKLNVFHQHITNIGLKAVQFANHEWSLKIAQKEVSADVRFQPTTRTLTGTIERLHIDKSMLSQKTTAQEEEKMSPEDIPNLQLLIKHFLYDDIDVGEVAIESKSTKTMFDVRSCKVTSPAYELALKGKWVKRHTQNNTDVEAELNTKSLSALLTHWHIKPTVEAKNGSISFDGRWAGAPSDFSWANVTGNLQVLFKGGRIKDLGSAAEGKIGFGKVLSIFSLQTIPRRLKLDFSDLSQNGYSFDQFKGDFKLKNGVLNTQNSIMDGPVAYVGMTGDVDIVKQLFQLQVRVTPYVMASLPVVATIVGGPVAGIATWAASKIINQGMYKVTAYSYKVSGPWSDPVVEQSNIEKKRE